MLNKLIFKKKHTKFFRFDKHTLMFPQAEKKPARTLHLTPKTGAPLPTTAGSSKLRDSQLSHCLQAHHTPIPGAD